MCIGLMINGQMSFFLTKVNSKYLGPSAVYLSEDLTEKGIKSIAYNLYSETRWWFCYGMGCDISQRSGSVEENRRNHGHEGI